MGRIYGMVPGADVRSAHGFRFFTHTGEKLLFLTRVEFKDEADEGLAKITGYAHTARGNVVIDWTKNAAAEVTFYTWVRAVPKDQPDPPLTPEAVLFDLGNGTIARFEKDPLPDEVLEELNRLGGAAAQG